MIDYQHNILSITSTILSKYGIENNYPALDLDLSKYNKIVLILMDGMGIYNMDPQDYLYSYLYTTLSTVFPPTTVAATTALRTGKSPLESGWIGWKQYFEKEDRYYVMFLNYDYYHREYKSEEPIEKKMDYHSFYENLPVPSYEIYPAFKTKGMKHFHDQIEYCNKLLRENQECFIYIYQDEYDALEHKYGVHSKKVIDYRHYVNETMKKLEIDKDTIVLFTADHGHIDVENIDLTLYPDLMDCFDHYPTLEYRALGLYVKEEKREFFEAKFKEYFGAYFKLMTKQEVLESHLLGYGIKHPLLDSFIGDYMALATSNKTLSMHHIYPNIGQHAGYTKEEMEIPLVVLKKTQD